VTGDGDLVLTGIRLASGETVDVTLAGDAITAVGERGAADGLAPDGQRLDLTGYLLLPAPAEPHSHFDKVLTGALLGNSSGDLDGAVASWYAYRRLVSHKDVRDRALHAAYDLLGQGATAIRTHVDVGTATGLVLVEALLEVREGLTGQVDLQIVGFVDHPVTGGPGGGNLTLLREAMRLGVEVVGGAPYRDPDPELCLRILLEVAADFQRPVDFHTDETLDTSSNSLQRLAELVLAEGFPYSVTASHCVSLGMQPPDVVHRIAELLAAAGIRVITCPATNLYLQARDGHTPKPRGLTAIGPLRAAGVVVAGGGDNVRDPFNPVGRGDPLETAALLVLAGHLAPADAYAAVSALARTVLDLPAVSVSAGSPAELLAIRAGTLSEAIGAASPDRIVIHRGRVASRTTVRRTFSGPAVRTTPL
jgi:cytosine/creatinine deaminase